MFWEGTVRVIRIVSITAEGLYKNQLCKSVTTYPVVNPSAYTHLQYYIIP